jgi:hypothetical protein
MAWRTYQFKNFSKFNNTSVSSKESSVAPIQTDSPALPLRPPRPSIALSEFCPQQRDESGYNAMELHNKPFGVRIVGVDNFISSLLTSVFVEQSIEVNLNDESNKITFFVQLELHYGVCDKVYFFFT